MCTPCGSELLLFTTTHYFSSLLYYIVYRYTTTVKWLQTVPVLCLSKYNRIRNIRVPVRFYRFKSLEKASWCFEIMGFLDKKTTTCSLSRSSLCVYRKKVSEHTHTHVYLFQGCGIKGLFHPGRWVMTGLHGFKWRQIHLRRAETPGIFRPECLSWRILPLSHTDISLMSQYIP